MRPFLILAPLSISSKVPANGVISEDITNGIGDNLASHAESPLSVGAEIAVLSTPF